MKGLITKGLLALGGAAALGSGLGCYRDLVDPCYPDRYQYMARQEVRAAIAPQVQNGHVLDQTVWNYHFEAGTDKLTPGGQNHLAYLARRRPAPDTMIYLQTALDVPYDPAKPEETVQKRAKLDNERTAAVQKFLQAQTDGRGLVFHVAVHDPSEVGIAARPVIQSLNRMYDGAQGMLGTVGAAAGAGASSNGGGGR
jgi:hypothetical protein